MESAVIVKIENLLKTYTEGGRTRRVLDGVQADIYEGEFFVMLGKSGSGKSTLLNMLSGIDSQSPLPAPWFTSRGCCWRMSRLATWTRMPAGAF